MCHDKPVSTAADHLERSTHSIGRRVRLDHLVVERGLAGTRTRADALILAGKVRVGDGDGARLDRKPGDLVARDTAVSLAAPPPFVSRGGHKLAAGLDAFALDLRDRICLDVGASTGGFTDVLLQRGAARVYALDVGRGQLADSLRRDPRVVAMDRTNARTLTATALPEAASFASIDVSFISLARVLGPVASALQDGGEIVALVKPQFEADRGQAKGGVVTDATVHRAVLKRVALGAAQSGLAPRGVVASPITGPEGNREFLVWLTAPDPRDPDRPRDVAAPPVFELDPAFTGQIEAATAP